MVMHNNYKNPKVNTLNLVCQTARSDLKWARPVKLLHAHLYTYLKRKKCYAYRRYKMILTDQLSFLPTGLPGPLNQAFTGPKTMLK